VEALLAFGAALLTLRLAGNLARRFRRTRRAELALWAAGLVAYALASAALAWGAAAGWDGRAFRVYYLFGGLLTAPLLGTGSLALTGRRWALLVAMAYAGFAAGVALAVPCHYDMFELNTASPDEFARECERLGQRYRILRAGERLSVGEGPDELVAQSH
jgi:hypothetical protein